ncbi:origin recognition complex subunit 4 [Sporothrix schenckii 1099-18]|uniref:Origin recognition complex subunit 4 n=1 Tax=Sporothrix schenckii 1099-18 TaxID=1397361 RepID=A0A0F2LZI7_SPOSC|nr:origin recognition complex subunit 4 [Sporothrix schenckii 1099-18]KJR82244.1 origin recognition complex subunit 4 [Sporothrix schenckii 1099-18]
MSGAIGRKRARSEDGNNDAVDENVPLTGTVEATGTVKRQRLAHSHSTASVANRTSASDDAALFPGANIATTPQTPRTVHAVASAITGALAYGVGSLVGASKDAGKARGQARDRLLARPFASLLHERNTRTTQQDDLDKLYEFPDDDGGDANASNRPTRAALESDVEENTLVGSASPTPDTPSKKQPQTPSAMKTASAATKTATDKNKKKRRDLLEDLAIDGTDKMAAGLEGGRLSRRDRVRTTPKNVDREIGNASTPNSASKSRSRGKAVNGGAPAAASPALAVEPDVAPGVALTTTEASSAPTSTRRRARSTTAAKVSSTADTPPKPLASPREKTNRTAMTDTEKGDEVTPASTRRSRAKATPAKTTEKLVPKRASRAKSTSKEAAGTATKDTSTKPLDQVVQNIPQTDSAPAEGGDSSDDTDDDVCAICSKPDSEPPNEIIFCETCDLAVHQQCYNVPVIPEGDWFCKKCLRQQNDDTLETAAGNQPTDSVGEESAADLTDKDDAAAAAAARDLAPDIANFEHHLARMKRVLLGRCTGRQRVRLQGQDDAYDKVYQVVKQTVVAGEGNSMMVIGARGTGKTTMVESILGALAAEHGGAFHVVRLNGFIHTDDKLALREIWRQLGKEMAVEDDVVNKTNNYADTLASLLALLSHPSEIQGAAIGTGAVEKDGDGAPDVTSTAVVFVMDEFDRFATHARQTLLYNLFDIAQARKAPIAVLGLTTKIDVVESLEKRVKSRFSHRYVYLPLARSLPAFWDICRHGLVIEDDDDKDGAGPKAVDIAMDVDETEGHAEFRQWWKHMIDSVKDDDHFQEQLAFHFYSTKSVAAFWTTCIMPLAAVSSTAPRLKLPPVGEAALSGGAAAAGSASSTDGPRSVGRPSLAALAASSTRKITKTTSLNDIDPLPLAPPDSKLHLLAALSELELSLLIAAARLDIVLSTDTVNFAMAYDEYVSLMGRQRVQSSLAGSGVGSGRGVGRPPGGSSSTVGGTVVGGGARVWGRGVASRAWESLAALSLLIPAGMGASARARGPGRPSNALVTSGLEGRSMWRTEVALEEIAAAPGVRLSAVMARWCKEI